MITEVLKSFASSVGKTFKSSASLNNTRANSPPPAKVKATRAACPLVSPNVGPEANIIPAFRPMKTGIPENKVGHSLRTVAGARPAPAVMKKIPRRMPSNGLISA